MKVLFIGGTGLLSGACTDLALERGIEVVHLNRGTRSDPRPGVTTIVADARDADAVMAGTAGQRFDAIVDFLAFAADDVERDIRLVRERGDQLVLVSSASVYAKPIRLWPVREDWPRANPWWAYARGKIACEDRLLEAVRDDGLPAVVVRPSHTYDHRSIPLAVRSLQRPFTSIARMRAGRPVIVPGDGTSLWTLTHATDFARGLVGLLGRPGLAGQVFNIMSDEALPWAEIYRETALAAGVELRPVHITSEFIADCLPDFRGRLLGDASATAIFDTGKLKRYVPDFRPAVSFSEGIRRAIAWFDADPSRQLVDEAEDVRWDRLIDAYERGLDHARVLFRNEQARPGTDRG